MSTTLVTKFTEAEARELTEELKSDYGALQTKIAAAWRGRIWTALDYESWQEYLDSEFSNISLRPPKEIEEQVISELRSAGMSTRGIASATDVSEATIRRRLDSATASNDAVERVIGLDGRERSAKRTKSVSQASSADVRPGPDIIDVEVIDDGDAEDTVTGGDRLVDDLGITPAPVDMTGAGSQGLSRDQVNRLISNLHSSGSAPLPMTKKHTKTLELAFSSGHMDTGAVDTERLDDLARDAADTMAVLSDLLAVMAGHGAGQVTAAMDNPDTIGSVEKTLTNLRAVTRGALGRTGA